MSTPHPADSLKSADGVLVRELVPPVWFLPNYAQEPTSRRTVTVNTVQLSDGKMHCYISVDNQSVNAGDVYQPEAKAWREVAARRRASADDAAERAFKAAQAGGGQ